MFQPFYYKFTPEKQKDGYSVGILSSLGCYAGDSTDAESPPTVVKTAVISDHGNISHPGKRK